MKCNKFLYTPSSMILRSRKLILLKATMKSSKFLIHWPSPMVYGSRTMAKFVKKWTIDFHGHVATTDPGFITDERLRSYWLKGRKFRIQAHPGLLESSIEANVDAFIHRASKRKRIDKQAFKAWKSKLLTAVRVKMNQIFREDADISHHTFLSKKGLEELSAIQEHMVVTYADKSAHDFVTCCKHVYKKLPWTELHSPHYENTAKTSAEIYNKHQSLSTQVGRPAYRYLYGILKLHKATVGMRWIAGNHMQAIEAPLELGGPKKMPACSLSPAEVAMGGILRMCMHNLENKDRACRQKGYKRYWVVTNVDRVAADIKKNLKKLKGQSVFTRDFARMYTSIPQDQSQTGHC